MLRLSRRLKLVSIFSPSRLCTVLLPFRNQCESAKDGKEGNVIDMNTFHLFRRLKQRGKHLVINQWKEERAIRWERSLISSPFFSFLNLSFRRIVCVRSECSLRERRQMRLWGINDDDDYLLRIRKRIKMEGKGVDKERTTLLIENGTREKRR